MLGHDDKPIRITGLDKVRIDVSKIPAYMIRNINRGLIDRAEEYFKDPQHVAACDAWLADYAARRASEQRRT